MKKPKTNYTDDGIKIIEHLVVKNDPARLKSITRYRKLMEIGQQVYDLREGAGLTHTKLANIAGLAPSVIADLEDAEYEGNAKKMLEHIADCLNKYSTAPGRDKNRAKKSRAG